MEISETKSDASYDIPMAALGASLEVGTHLTPRKEDIESIHDINTDPSEINNEPAPSESRVKHTWRFWVVFFSLCLISFISAIDATIVVTALSVITRSIGGESKYVWLRIVSRWQRLRRSRSMVKSLTYLAVETLC